MHLIAHMQERDGHAVILKLTGVGHPLIGKRIVACGQDKRGSKPFEIVGQKRRGAWISVVTLVAKVVAYEILYGLDGKRELREVAPVLISVPG